MVNDDEKNENGSDDAADDIYYCYDNNFIDAIFSLVYLYLFI